MANQEHLSLIKQDVETWNLWREENPDLAPDLSHADLEGADLAGANLAGANLAEANLSNAVLHSAELEDADLTEADLSGADLTEANLRGAILRGITIDAGPGPYVSWTEEGQSFQGKATFTKANLYLADLSNADISGADFTEAYLSRAQLEETNLTGTILTRANIWLTNFTGAILSGADLRGCYIHGTLFDGADLTEADLSYSSLVQTSFRDATLAGAVIYGISAWDVDLEGADQTGLCITREGPTITVDDLEVAQFIYLLLNNSKIRNVIDTVAQKAVLILGRFSPERKEVLDAIADRLRSEDYLPIMFDFEKSSRRDFTETVMTLAGMSLFVIADITSPRSIPLELQASVPNYMIPFVPIIEKGEEPFAMFVDLQHKYDWVMPIVSYSNKDALLEVFDRAIKTPALAMHQKLLMRKARKLQMIDADTLLTDAGEGA